jgi:hypothetical protein
MKLKILISLLVLGNIAFAQEERIKKHEIGINQNVLFDINKSNYFESISTISISKFTPSFTYNSSGKFFNRFELSHFSIEHFRSKTVLNETTTTGFNNNSFEVGLDYSLYYKIKNF